jgi:hypothetical protein
MIIGKLKLLMFNTKRMNVSYDLVLLAGVSLLEVDHLHR